MNDKPQRIHSRQMFDALTAAGIIRHGDYVRRVVIDVQVGCAVIVHVERYGDDRMLTVARELEGVEIISEPRRHQHLYCGPCRLDFDDHDALFRHVWERHYEEAHPGG